jgi:hypothetical protein
LPIPEGDLENAMANLSRGDQLNVFEVCLTTADVVAYLAATGEQNAAWDVSTPPLAIGALALGGLMERVGIPEGLLHTGQEFDFLRPVPHGEPVEVRITVSAASVRRGALMIVFELELHSTGELVGTGRTNIIVAPVEATEELS